MLEWGSIDDLEEKREDVLDLISELEVEATQIFICYTVEKLIAILRNIIQNPQDDKYKILKMDNQTFYSNIGRFSIGIKLLKFLGFVSVRLDNNKLAYKYDVPTSKGIHPYLLLAYDELRTCLAKSKSDKLQFPSQNSSQNLVEIMQEEQDRVECTLCKRKFAVDRVDKHE